MSNHTDDDKHNDPQMGRRAFLQKATAAVAAASILGNAKEAEAAGMSQNTKWVVEDKPLMAKEPKESAEDYGKRYAEHFTSHIDGYKVPLVAAMADTKEEFPLAVEFVPGYRCCIMPAGKPLSGSKPMITLPTILIENPLRDQNNNSWWKQMVTNVEVTRGGKMANGARSVEMTITFKINKDGTGVGFYGGMKGCEYKVIKSDIEKLKSDINNATGQEKEELEKQKDLLIKQYAQHKLSFGAWKKFPAVEKEQQETVLPAAGAAKAGDIVEIKIPSAVFAAAAKQLDQVAPDKFKQAIQTSALDMHGAENLAAAEPMTAGEYSQQQRNMVAAADRMKLVDSSALAQTDKVTRGRNDLQASLRNGPVV